MFVHSYKCQKSESEILWTRSPKPPNDRVPEDKFTSTQKKVFTNTQQIKIMKYTTYNGQAAKKQPIHVTMTILVQANFFNLGIWCLWDFYPSSRSSVDGRREDRTKFNDVVAWFGIKVFSENEFFSYTWIPPSLAQSALANMENCINLPIDEEWVGIDLVYLSFLKIASSHTRKKVQEILEELFTSRFLHKKMTLER